MYSCAALVLAPAIETETVLDSASVAVRAAADELEHTVPVVQLVAACMFVARATGCTAVVAAAKAVQVGQVARSEQGVVGPAAVAAADMDLGQAGTVVVPGFEEGTEAVAVHGFEEGTAVAAAVRTAVVSATAADAFQAAQIVVAEAAAVAAPAATPGSPAHRS